MIDSSRGPTVDRLLLGFEGLGETRYHALGMSVSASNTWSAWVETVAASTYAAPLAIVGYVVRFQHAQMVGQFSFGTGASGAEVEFFRTGFNGMGQPSNNVPQNVVTLLPRPVIVPGGDPHPRLACRYQYSHSSVAGSITPNAHVILRTKAEA